MEKLYNNIVLPDEWPPNEVRFDSDEVIDAPYLRVKPDVIDISVGRQLFVDDFLVADRKGLAPFYHKATKYEGNPVFKPETPEECNESLPCACPKSGGVWFDRDDKKYKMWYEAGWCNHMAYAESDDGLHWTRPSLDSRPGTNLILSDIMSDSSAVIIDYDTKKPEEKYKMFLRSPGGIMPGYAMVSGDGVHWTRITGTSPLGDRSTIFYNPFRKKWVYSIRTCDGSVPGWRRAKNDRLREYWEADDYIEGANWLDENGKKKCVPWLRTDKYDLRDPMTGQYPQLYNFDAVGYESIMLGMFQIFKGPTNGECDAGGFPKLTELIATYSRDGFHFTRPDRECFISASREVGEWDRGYVQCVGGICLIQGDELWFYYIGFEGDEGRTLPRGKLNGMHDLSSTGIAKLRRDGFVSMDGTGTLTTEKLTVEKGRDLFFINAKAIHGEVRAALLDAEGKVIPGYSEEDCIPFIGNSTCARLTWKNKETCELPEVFRVRFRQRNAQLYAFWFSDTPDGNSHGYDAAGTPTVPQKI